MQSLLQHRRMRKHLQTRITEDGIRAIAAVREDSTTSSTTDQLEKGTEAGVNDGNLKNIQDDSDISAEPSIQISSGTQVQQDAHLKSLEAGSTQHLVIDFEGPGDPLNPQSWLLVRKWAYTMLIGCISFLISGAAAFDTEVTLQAAKAFGVSEEVELLNTTLYMIALGLGSMISAPFSETVGRNPVYIICLTAFALFEVGVALAPNIQTQLSCRFFAAFFGCPPLTAFGGSISDMWTPLERTYVFPILSVCNFIVPFLAPTVADFIATSPAISWRWTDWLTAIVAGWIVLLLVLFMPETYPPVILTWKAQHLRAISGDERYRAPSELRHINLGLRLLRSISRPVKFLLTEPILDLFSLYLTIVYVILFGFLPGYGYIFGKKGIYGFNQKHTGLCFLAINVGFLAGLIPIMPIYRRFKRKLHAAREAGIEKVDPEERLLFSMIGAPFMPIAIFWMAWSSWRSVSYWSPIVASAFFGFATLGIFVTSYQYIIDCYEVYAASALVGMTVTRYCVSGPMVIASVPMYERLGVHWTLTLVGCLSLLMTPVPYVFYLFGAAIRKKSRSATSFAS